MRKATIAAIRRTSRHLIPVFSCWLLFVAIPSLPVLRNVLAYPLVTSSIQARGEAVYVLAGGTSFFERLAAASDLYHLGRVNKILLSANTTLGSYNFVARSNWTPTQWALSFLASRGVAPENVVVIKQEPKGWFGTLSEARLVRDVLPDTMTCLVIVTSAAHTRRSLLAFRRTLGDRVEVVAYAATGFTHSQEMYRPLWLEYIKLFVYAIVA